MPSSLRLHRRLGEEAATRLCLMAYAPARPRCGRGFSRRPAALAKTAGQSRPPSGLFRPQRSVSQVADEGTGPRLWTRPRRDVGKARGRSGVAGRAAGAGDGAPCEGEGLRTDQARRGPAMDGRPFSLSHGWRIENPRPKPVPRGRSYKTLPRSGLLPPRVVVARSAVAGPSRSARHARTPATAAKKKPRSARL